MSGLTPVPFGRLAGRMLRELESGGPVLGLPRRAFFGGDPRHDLSVKVHGRRVSSPLGPAAGPHTQLAHNIAAAWLAGARVFELKTVQVLDKLSIPRPCIDMRTVGFNVEWSQELSLEQSLEEYVKAAMLTDLLKASALAPGYELALFDMSVGYDLAGLRDERVQAFMAGLRDARPAVDRLRRELPPRWRELDFTTRVADTVTLSTFHGCPPGEIEAMAASLLERGLSVSIKLNPTLLGPQEARRLLHEELGYAELRIPDEAFAKDARWEQVAEFCGRLSARAWELGVGFGVKFCNTLVVENPGDFLPASERTRYLSGAPLHALAARLVARFRGAFGDAIPVSFSAGVDRVNFPDAVALGLAPVTVCSDLLKPGGYGRLKGYLEELGRRMDAAGAADIDAFIRASVPGARTPAEALRLGPEAYAARVVREGRCARARNCAPPKKIGRRLSLFDCLACDKCLLACPNGALFAYAPAAGGLKLGAKQIAVFADLCNECGNCDAFCPEDGGPYKTKPRFFGSLEAWRATTSDGFHVARSPDAVEVYGRLGGRELLLRAAGGLLECSGPGLRRVLAEGELRAGEAALAPFVIMDVLRRSVLAPGASSFVNA